MSWSVSMSRALCSTIRLGMCSRIATISFPFQPSFCSVPGRSAEAPTVLLNTCGRSPPLSA